MATLTLKNYKKAVETLNKWAYAYYTLNEPLATDAEYDNLYHKILSFEKETGIIDPLSPTQRVGDKTNPAFKKSQHLQKMYSLQDIFEENELKEWLEAFPEDSLFELEPKFDGVSLNLLYEDGVLKKGSTRGNGEEGENITDNIPYIQGIPLTIPYKGIVEIRGEVTIFKKDFPLVNEERIANGDKPFANERNAASGALTSLDTSKIKRARLKFTPYTLGFNNLNLNTQSEEIVWILSQGFHYWGIDNKIALLSKKEIYDFYLKMVEERDNYPMLLDGLVIKVNDKTLQSKMGFTSKYPKWAVAFKFPAIEKTTKLLDVVNQVGKTGAITPVAIIKPTNIGGAEVSRVTLHNFEEIKRKDLKIGDTISVIRSGDVIPKINQVFKDRRDGSEKTIKEPTFCPCCGVTLQKRENVDGSQSSAIFCLNASCADQVKYKFLSALGRKGLDIKGFGERVVEGLLTKLSISYLPELWDTTEEDFLLIDRMGKKSAKNLIEALNSKRKASKLDKIIYALNIPLIGESASKSIVNALKEELFDIENLFIEKVEAIPDIGQAMALNFVEFLKENFCLFMDLVDILWDGQLPTTSVDTNSDFKGKTVVITGTLSKPRGWYKEELEKRGAKVSSAISKKTDFLLAGEKAGSKLDKAQELGVKVLSENDLPF